jgi:uroporphyrinogen-III decarboxylase
MITANERFYTALSGEEPDRVPVLPKIWVDLAASLTNTDLTQLIEDPFLAMELIVKAGLEVKADGARLFHFPSRMTAMHLGGLAEIDSKGRVRGRIDMEGGLATQLNPDESISLEDPYYMAFIQFWNTKKPLVNTMADVRRLAIPGKSLYRDLGFEDFQKDLYLRHSDSIALIGDCASATLAFCVLYRKLDNALMDFIMNPELVHALMEKGVEIAIEKGKFHIDCGIKMLRLNDSVANMSVISPAQFKEFIFPHMKTLCEELHAYDPEVKIYCHICGNVLPVMDLLVTTGLDCVGPLDPLGGFSAEEARKAAGNRVALMGGVNTLTFLNGTPEQVAYEARECLENYGKKGYILGSGCVVPRGTKKENLLVLHAETERLRLIS